MRCALWQLMLAAMALLTANCLSHVHAATEWLVR